ALLVEGAVGLVLAARLLERHELRDHVDDVGARAHLLDLLVGDHDAASRNPATVTPAPPSVGPPIRTERTRRSARSISPTRLRRSPVLFPCVMRSSGRSSRRGSSRARAGSISSSSTRSPGRPTSRRAAPRSGPVHPPPRRGVVSAPV